MYRISCTEPDQRDIKEVLPYMNIYPDEEQTGVNADLTITGANPPTGEKVTQEGEQGE